MCDYCLVVQHKAIENIKDHTNFHGMAFHTSATLAGNKKGDFMKAYCWHFESWLSELVELKNEKRYTRGCSVN